MKLCRFGHVIHELKQQIVELRDQVYLQLFTKDGMLDADPCTVAAGLGPGRTFFKSEKAPVCWFF